MMLLSLCHTFTPASDTATGEHLFYVSVFLLHSHSFRSKQQSDSVTSEWRSSQITGPND